MVRKLSKYWHWIVISVLLIVCFTSIRSCSVNDDRAVIAGIRADSSYMTAKYYQNKNGELIGQVNTHTLTIDNLKEYGNQLGFDNRALKEQVVNLKNLVAHWQGRVGIRDTIRTVMHDTTFVEKGVLVEGKTSNWNNKWMYLQAILVNDDLTISYLYNVDFSLTAYRKPQKGFWKPPGQLVADIKFSDPNFKVTEFKGFVIEEPRKRWYQTTGAKIGFGALLGGAAAIQLTR